MVLVFSVPLFYVRAQETAEDHDTTTTAATANGTTATSTVVGGPVLTDPDLSVNMTAQGLLLPTAMAFVDEDRILVLEKDNGTVRLVEDGRLIEEPALDVAVANENERGLLGIAVANVSDMTTYVFLYYTESGGGVDGDDRSGVDPAGNRLYRYELQDNKLVNPELLLDLPALPGPRYNGGPVVVGPDGFVYVMIGDVEGHATQAQNFEDGPAADGTSGILRVGMDGQIPPSVIGTGVFGKYYYAYGIRNSFGMAFDPVAGNLWDTENGPASGDEINLVEPGFNSGWRDIYGMASSSNQTLDGLVLFNSMSKYSDPELAWVEPIGPTALAFLDSDALGEEYQDDMFVGDILNGAVYRFDLDQNRTSLALAGVLSDKVSDVPAENEGTIFGSGFGGVTDIKTGPDGALYVLSFINGAIYRISSNASQPSEPEPETVTPAPIPPQASPQENGEERALQSIITRLAISLDNDDCFDEKDQHRLGNVLSKIIKDIFGENQIRTDKLEQTLQRIVEDCEDNGNNGSSSSSSIIIQSNGNDDDDNNDNNSRGDRGHHGNGGNSSGKGNSDND
ncbi:MAG TPA: PQQ-dependent sugar dehydrogenase [Nitrososphaera sp.]|nr:PQQ-dependent sugar dehydrogenase [Nitrososphaera sp.]